MERSGGGGAKRSRAGTAEASVPTEPATACAEGEEEGPLRKTARASSGAAKQGSSTADVAAVGAQLGGKAASGQARLGAKAAAPALVTVPVLKADAARLLSRRTSGFHVEDGVQAFDATVRGARQIGDAGRISVSGERRCTGLLKIGRFAGFKSACCKDHCRKARQMLGMLA